jgi:peptidyl-prolyl cis-trans isomerase C
MARLLNLLAATGLALSTTGMLPAQEPAATDPVLLEVDGRAFPASEILRFYVERHDGHIAIIENEMALRVLVDRVRDFYLLEAAARSEGLEENEAVRKEVAETIRKTSSSKWFQDQLAERLVVDRAQIEDYADSLFQVYEFREIETKSRAQADRAVAELEAGRSFEEAAPMFSQVDSRIRGGLVAGVRLDMLPWQVAEWMKGKQPGDRSSVIAHARGFSIIELVSVTEEEPEPEYIEERRLLVKIQAMEQDKVVRGIRDELRAAANSRMVVDFDAAWMFQGGGGEADMVVAEADGVEPVTLGEVREDFSLPPQFFEDSELVAEVAAFSAMGLLDIRLQAAAAIRDGYAEDPEVLAQAQAVREDLLVKALKITLIYEDFDITEEELLAIFEAQRERFDRPPEAEVKHILVETEGEARELAAALADGLDFAEAASSRSLDTQTGAAGGYVGWVGKGAILPELDTAIWELANGELSAPIQTKVGWHLITVLRRRPGQEVPFQSVRSRIFEDEVRRRRKAQTDEWVGLLLDRVPWKAHPENLEAAMEEVRRQTAATVKKTAPAGHAF